MKHFINDTVPSRLTRRDPSQGSAVRGTGLSERTRSAGQDLLSQWQIPWEPGWGRSGVGVCSQRTRGPCEPSWGLCVGSRFLDRNLCYIVGSHSWESSSCPFQEEPPDEASGSGYRGNGKDRAAWRSASAQHRQAGGARAVAEQFHPHPGKPAGCQLLEVMHINPG